jgi:hypothetical protein
MTLKNDLRHIYKILIRKDPKNKLFLSMVDIWVKNKKV